MDCGGKAIGGHVGRGLIVIVWVHQRVDNSARLGAELFLATVRITPGIPYFSTSLDSRSFHFIIIPNYQHLFSLSPYLTF